MHMTWYAYNFHENFVIFNLELRAMALLREQNIGTGHYLVTSSKPLKKFKDNKNSQRASFFGTISYLHFIFIFSYFRNILTAMTTHVTIKNFCPKWYVNMCRNVLLNFQYVTFVLWKSNETKYTRNDTNRSK